jgi:flavin-dependent dehydrogenase
MRRIVIIGASISGSLAACYLKVRFPDVDVVAIQKAGARHPIVGESLTEFSTRLFHEIGLGSYLETNHFHKYGLTYYFKERLDDPADMTYAVHEATRIPPMPSNQINRFTMAERLDARRAELGVRTVEAMVSDVTIAGRGRNRVTYTDDAGTSSEIEADWIVDASGRSRVLANKLGLNSKPPFQRSAFWMRLRGFDKSILDGIRAVKEPQGCFNSYYVTHHFLGHGYWIWAIPMRAPDGGNLISIGVVYRPDLRPGKIATLEDFKTQIGAEHPALIRLIDSGHVADTNVYRNYFHETAQSYSEQGWCIIGDAGDTVDPLYSTGLATTAVQIKQVEAIIAADRDRALTADTVRDLERAYKSIRDQMQYEIATLFEVIHDPYQAHLRIHCASAFYFYVLLPCWLAGFIADPARARFLTGIIERGRPRFQSLRDLLMAASKRRGPLPAAEIRNLYDRSVNWELHGPAEDDIPRDFARCALFFAGVRFRALRDAGWHRAPKHLSLCALDLMTAFTAGIIVGRHGMRLMRGARRLWSRMTAPDRIGAPDWQTGRRTFRNTPS